MTYCLNCKKEIIDKDICECGSKSIVFGDNFTFNNENQIMCFCGSIAFRKIMHMNLTHKSVNNYKCNCGNVIGTEFHR